MHDDIAFPHLGIYLNHVIKTITLPGGFTVAMYGITMALSMLAGLCLAMRVAKKTGQNPDEYLNFALIGIVAALLGARIYYVAFTWDYYSRHPLEILNFRGGGLALYGSVIAGVLTIVIYARVRKLSLPLMLDTASTGMVLGQIIGRWGNFFNREAFGQYSDGLFAMRLPVDAVRADEITELMKQHAYTVNRVTYIQVHPTFLYESLWNVGVLTVLLLVTFSGKKRFHGEIFLLYLLLYSAGRAWIEGLRTDQLRFAHTAIAVSQLLACILVIVSGISLIVLSRREKSSRGGKS
ncbi:MAG TPA: prolipoprotein diacylglyceryl transferase [Lachnospiraceae bacterium]|nr:prolipoprotein diacylglyceryl transferase [Lachnospiraceae bacterium]